MEIYRYLPSKRGTQAPGVHGHHAGGGGRGAPTVRRTQAAASPVMRRPPGYFGGRFSWAGRVAPVRAMGRVGGRRCRSRAQLGCHDACGAGYTGNRSSLLCAVHGRRFRPLGEGFSGISLLRGRPGLPGGGGGGPWLLPVFREEGAPRARAQEICAARDSRTNSC